MTDELKDLESELDAAIGGDEITDEDFAAIKDETEEPEPEIEDDDEPEPEPEPEPKPVIDDRDPEIEKAAEVAQQWQAYLASKEQELAAIKAKMVEADELDKSAEERVALQTQLADTMLEIRSAKEKTQAAIDYHRQVAAPKPPAMTAWIAKNSKYKSDPSFKARVDRIAMALHDQEGLNPSHARFYQELDKRLMTKKPLGKPGKHGAAAVRRTERAESKQSDTPTAQERKIMRGAGIVSNSKEALAEFRHHFKDLLREEGRAA